MIVALGWFLVVVFSLLMVVLAIAPLWIERGRGGCCCGCGFDGCLCDEGCEEE